MPTKAFSAACARIALSTEAWRLPVAAAAIWTSANSSKADKERPIPFGTLPRDRDIQPDQRLASPRQHGHNTTYIVPPATAGSGLKLGSGQEHGAFGVEIERNNMDFIVGSSATGHLRLDAEIDGQRKAVIIVGMLADQLHPARSGRYGAPLDAARGRRRRDARGSPTR